MPPLYPASFSTGANWFKSSGNPRPANARHKPAKEPLYRWEGVVSPALGVAGHTGPYRRSRGASGLTLQLFLVVLLHHLCDGTDREEQVAVSPAAIPICDCSRLGCDEALCLQAADVLSHRVDAHSRRPPDGPAAGPALKCFPVFAEKEIGIHRNLSRV